MDVVENRVRAEFAAFARDSDPSHAEQALAMVESAVLETPTGEPGRSDAVERWLMFLAELDGALDPEWNLDSPPARGIPPPPGFTGPVYPSGEIDPATIDDPSARETYQESLAAARSAFERWGTQLQLRRVGERATSLLEFVVQQRYRGSEGDLRELDMLVNRSALTDQRVGQIRSLVIAAARQNRVDPS